jgi:hypothetical protein
MVSFMEDRLTQSTFLIFPGNLYKSRSLSELPQCLYYLNITFSIYARFYLHFYAFLLLVLQLALLFLLDDPLPRIYALKIEISIPKKIRRNLITLCIFFLYRKAN